jgi:hypothetical protein
MSGLALFKNNIPAYLKNVELDEVTKALVKGGNKLKRIALGNNKFVLKIGGEEISKSATNKMEVVVVNASPEVSRTFYMTAYDPDGDATSPDCWSPNGRTPDVSIAEPQHTNCDSCPKNIEGSGQGKTKACRFSRRIAVVLANDLEGDVFQMELKSKSFFYSKKDPGDLDHMPFDQYANYVGSQGFSLSNLVTEMSFDEDATVGKLFFRPTRFLEEDESIIAKRQQESEPAKKAVTMTVAQTDGVTAKALPAPKAEPKVKAEAEVGDDGIAEPKKKQEKKAEPAPKKDIANILGAWAHSDEDE